MVQLQDRIDEINSLGWRLVAVNPDTPENTAALKAKLKLGFDLVSDSRMEAARAFGLAWKVDARTKEALQGFGIDLVKSAGADHGLLPVPAVLLLDEKGKILFQYANPTYQVRLPHDLLVAAAKAYAEG